MSNRNTDRLVWQGDHLQLHPRLRPSDVGQVTARPEDVYSQQPEYMEKAMSYSWEEPEAPEYSWELEKAAGGKKKKIKSKSEVAKEAREGKDLGHPGKGFDEVAAKASKEYGSAEAGKRVAAAAMWKMRKRGQL